MEINIEICNYEMFIELAKAVEHSLNELDMIDKFKDMIFIIRALKPHTPEDNMILIQTEQLLKADAHHLSNRYFKVLEMFYQNTKFKSGVENVVYCPIGYSPVWESNLKPVEKDIDVLFYGAVTRRRENFFKQLALYCQGNIVIRDDLYGRPRARFINRSKIVLYIHPNSPDKRYHAPLHMLPAQANKAFCLVEKSQDYGLFKPGINFHTFRDINECKYMIEKWCNDDINREFFAQQAYDDLKQNCNFTDIIEKIIEREFI